MPSLSKKQQKFMGIVRSIQKGDQPASKFSKDAQDAAKDMRKSSVKKFASTKHKGLPMKKEQQYGTGDIVKDVNPTCPHYGAMGKVKKVKPNSVVFVVKNKGDNFEPGQELEKSHDQMKKVNEMSAKSKKIINKLNKKEKDMFMDMVDMMGFDQVMADYKRDKKAFKQALKDMSESINEDGHTDVASSKRKVMIMVQDSNKLLNKLNGMNKEDSLPSWWTDKITLSQNYLAKATDYITNPVESVNEGKGVEKVLKMANDHSFGKLGGRTVDALSAGLFKGVYDKASQNAKDKINKMNEKQLYVFMTKLWSKFGNQVRIG